MPIKRKLKTITIVTTALAVFVVTMALAFVGPQRIGRPPPPPPEVQPDKPEVKLVLDFGEGEIATVSTTARTAFEALVTVADVKGIPIKTKQYDFGVFVESIRDIANTRDKAWIYFVNGVSGKVAADKYKLQQGDVVEWKYTKPKD